MHGNVSRWVLNHIFLVVNSCWEINVNISWIARLICVNNIVQYSWNTVWISYPNVHDIKRLYGNDKFYLFQSVNLVNHWCTDFDEFFSSCFDLSYLIYGQNILMRVFEVGNFSKLIETHSESVKSRERLNLFYELLLNGLEFGRLHSTAPIVIFDKSLWFSIGFCNQIVLVQTRCSSEHSNYYICGKFPLEIHVFRNFEGTNVPMRIVHVTQCPLLKLQTYTFLEVYLFHHQKFNTPASFENNVLWKKISIYIRFVMCVVLGKEKNSIFWDKMKVQK